VLRFQQWVHSTNSRPEHTPSGSALIRSHADEVFAILLHASACALTVDENVRSVVPRVSAANPLKRFFVFANENHRATYCPAVPGESPNDRNDRAIRATTAWCGAEGLTVRRPPSGLSPPSSSYS
jgi:hypothetical protein